jgi:hypothetical protein
VIFACDGFEQKGNENHNIIIHAFRSTPTKPQFKALTAIKPEATKPETQKICNLMQTTKSACDRPTTEGTEIFQNVKLRGTNFPFTINPNYDLSEL